MTVPTYSGVESMIRVEYIRAKNLMYTVSWCSSIPYIELYVGLYQAIIPYSIQQLYTVQIFL